MVSLSDSPVSSTTSDSPADEWLSPLATWPGAILTSDDLGDQATRAQEADTPEEGAEPQTFAIPVTPIALHYGDPLGEQWALEEGRAITDRADLGVRVWCGSSDVADQHYDADCHGYGPGGFEGASGSGSSGSY